MNRILLSKYMKKKKVAFNHTKKALVVFSLVGLLGCSGNVLSDSDSSRVNGIGDGSSNSPVRFDALQIVNTSNAGAYEISGTCLTELGSVSVTVFSPQDSQNSFCINNKFSAIFDLTSILSPELSVIVTQGPLTEELAVRPPVDLIVPTVTLDAPSNIGFTNESSYSLSGTCSENGVHLIVSIDGISPSSDPLCASGVWSISSFDASGISEGNVDIIVNHIDLAGNYATEVTASVVKDLTPPVFHAQSIATTGGFNINVSPAQDLLWTGLTVSPEFFSINPTNNDEIIVVQGGDYRLSLTLPMQTTVQRSNVAVKINVNGTDIQGGYSASSYVRNISGHNSSSDHLDLILSDLNLGDVIEVEVEREAVSGNTIIVTPAQLFIEPVDASQTFVATSNILSSGTNLNVDPSSPVSLEWLELKTNPAYTLSSTNPANLTINDTGHYLVSLNIPLRSTSARVNILSRLTLDGVNVEGSSARQGYMRRDSGHDNSSIHWVGLVQINSGEVLNVRVARDANSGTVNFLLGQSARLSIERLNVSEFIDLRAQDVAAGANWNQNSTVDWDIQESIDASFFDHSLSFNSDEITLIESGNYYISYSDSLFSTVQRSSVVIDVLVNGNPTGIKCDSHYIRSSDGHNESSCALSGYLSSLNAGDIVSISTSIGATSGNTISNDDARLMILKKD